MEKSPADLWAILNWLHPKVFPSYWNFFEEFVEYENPWIGGHARRDIKIPLGTKKDKGGDLSRLLEPIFIRRTKKEVRPDIPPNIKHRIPITLDKEEKQYKLYSSIATAKDIEVDLSEIRSPLDVPSILVPNMLAKIVRLQQVLADPNILDIKASSAKLEWLKDYVNDNPDEPIVVFTKFRHTAKVISKMIDAQLAIGGTQLTLPLEGVQRLVGTIKYIGASLNLQWASTAIFITPEWSTIDMSQALDRIHRIDITETKTTYFLRVPRTVDDLVLKALDGKWSAQELVYHFIKGDSNDWEI
jgi:SNF2 family DNA or RNA helicase